MRRATLMRWFCCGVVAFGCGHAVPEVPTQPAPAVAHAPTTFVAGAALADITMPPGASTFGHALDSRVSEGYWTRTYCRAFYFETALGRKLAIVPCELPAMSLLLHRQVVAYLDGALAPSEVMITATHTHAGVAHFFGAAQYTGSFSSRLPGYDVELMRTLARKISDAIIEAKKHAQPARLSWSHSSEFWGYTRNRSLDAYRLNHPPFARHPPEGPPFDDAWFAARADLHAIDPDMHVLRIDAAGPEGDSAVRPIGSLSFFAMHPTVIGSGNRLFGGDVLGVASRVVEGHLRRLACRAAAEPCALGRPPLHGVINTNEGDISPIWSRGDIDEAIVVGTRVGQFVIDHHPKDGSDGEPIIDARYVEEHVPNLSFMDEGVPGRLCETPFLGQGAPRGGTDHATSVASLPLFATAATADYESHDCQAPKRPLLGCLSYLTSQFPEVVPLGVVRLGDTVVSFVPAEMTVTAGQRLNQRVRGATAGYPRAPKHFVVAGLANEYIEYAATKEEYQLQMYEGASTIYGSDTADYLANRTALLARAMFDPAVESFISDELGLTLGAPREEVPFSFGRRVVRMARPEPKDVTPSHLGTCVMPIRGTKAPPKLCTYWHDGSPGAVGLTTHPAPWVRLVRDDEARTPVKVCGGATTCDPLGYVDDRGVEFRTKIHDEVAGAWVWSTAFSPSKETWDAIRSEGSRIRVGFSEPYVESAAFSDACMPPTCTVEQARLCTEGARVTEWDRLVPER